MGSTADANQKGEKVVFRRIKGKIVPIKVGKSLNKADRRQKGLVGGSATVGGVAASAFGGSVFAVAGEEASRARRMQRVFAKRARSFDISKAAVQQELFGGGPDQLDLFSDKPRADRFKTARTQNLRASRRASRRAAFFTRAGSLVGGTSLVLGGAAISFGIQNSAEAIKGQQLEFEEGFAVNVAAGGAALVAANRLSAGTGFTAKKSLGIIKDLAKKRFFKVRKIF